MKKNRILIKGARLVTEEGERSADLLVEGDKIKRIDSSLSVGDRVKEIDASGRIVFPGVIDPHVHMELKAYNSFSSDDFYSGSRAAAAGGVTTFIDFAIPLPGQSMACRVREKKEQALSKSIIDFSFHSQIVDWDNKKSPADMEKAAGEGIRSFKIFMPATQGWGVDDYALYRALQNSSSFRSLVMVHAENGSISEKIKEEYIQKGLTSISRYSETRPDVAEREAVSRAAVLAHEAGAPVYICHLSSGKAAADLRNLKREGRDILVETTPHYLLLNREKYNQKNGFLYASSPPLRSQEDNWQLWRGIIEDTVDTIGTDHCPFLKREKRRGAGDFTSVPMGMGGVENSFSLLYSEGIVKRGLTPFELMRLTSLNPAKIFGLYPRKGTLMEGSDADLLIFNPAGKKKVKASKMFSACDWDPYEGMELKGRVEKTISRGEIVFSGSKIKAGKGRGIFLKRSSPQRLTF